MSIDEMLLKAKQEGYKEGFADGRKYTPRPVLVGKAKRIETVVCEYFEVEFENLVNHSRKVEVCYPRQVIMFFLDENTKMGHTAIGRVFNRNHGTVWKAKKSIQNRIDTDEFTRRDIRLLNEKINQCLHT
jgi:chromosomal replication initiation ATPase DnaA